MNVFVIYDAALCRSERRSSGEKWAKIKLLIVESAMKHLLCFATIKAWNWLLKQRLEWTLYGCGTQKLCKHFEIRPKFLCEWESEIRQRNEESETEPETEKYGTIESLSCISLARIQVNNSCTIQCPDTHLCRDRSPKNNYTETRQANFRLWKHRKWVQHNAQTYYWNSSCLDFAERASHFALRSNKNVNWRCCRACCFSF